MELDLYKQQSLAVAENMAAGAKALEGYLGKLQTYSVEGRAEGRAEVDRVMKERDEARAKLMRERDKG